MGTGEVICAQLDLTARISRPRRALHQGVLAAFSLSRQFPFVGAKRPRDSMALRHRSTATATVLYARELGLVPITTPAYSPESNGLAEGFVHTFKRDYVNVHELRDAESVLAQLAAWMDDYNRLAPHSALGMRSPADYRAVTSASGELTPPSV